MKKYYQENRNNIREKQRIYHKKYYKRNRKRKLEQRKEYYKRHKPSFIKRRARFLKSKYNLSLKDYNSLFKKQKGCCAICGKHQSEFKIKFCVDHDHKTGKVRGLLCKYCNHCYGWFEKYKNKALKYYKHNK